MEADAAGKPPRSVVDVLADGYTLHDRLLRSGARSSHKISAVAAGGGTMTLHLHGPAAARVLRLRGRGVPRPDGSKGDEYVTLTIMLPKKSDPELERFVVQWQPAEHSPRQSMGV